jgi:hypothetical protein
MPSRVRITCGIAAAAARFPGATSTSSGSVTSTEHKLELSRERSHAKPDAGLTRRARGSDSHARSEFEFVTRASVQARADVLLVSLFLA